MKTSRRPSWRLWRWALLAIPTGVVAASVLAGASALHGSVPVRSSDVSFNSSSFSYNAAAGTGVAISAAQYTRGAPGVLALSVYGMPPQGAGNSAALVYADLDNQTGQTATFSGGAAVQVTIRRDGRPWMTVGLNQPVTASLAAGQRVRLQTTVHLDASGHYELSGELVGHDGSPAFTLSPE